MRIPLPLLILVPLAGVLACAPAGAGAPPRAAAEPPAAAAPAATRDDAGCYPLLLEGDLGFGTHVVMRRLPDAADMDELRFVTGLRQIVVALPEWPAGFEQLKPLQQTILPDGAQLVVLLPGWPPTHEALNAWNLVTAPLRLIMVVPGPPADRGLILEVNRLRALERVVAQMEHPARSGFERLQRPLSFRVVKP